MTILQKISPVKVAIGLLLLSLFSLVLLILCSLTTPRSVYLSKFTLDRSLSKVIGHETLTFGIWSHCVDDKCSKPNILYKFDSMPTDEFQDDGRKSSGGGFDDVVEFAKNLFAQFLEAMQNFKPQIDTSRFAAFFSLPYVLAALLIIIALVLLRLGFLTIATFVVIGAAVLNAIGFVFNLILFVWVFDLVFLIPGIGSRTNGASIYFAGISSVSLVSAAILFCFARCT
jgi:hypothetical protein